MKILITSAATPLAQALAKHLSSNHQVQLTDLVDVDADGDFVKCGLDHEGETEDLVDGVDAIVHLATLPESLKSDEAEVDFQTCREFARENSVRVTCLRLGDVGGTGTDALAMDNAVNVIEKALEKPGSMWRVLHVQSDVPNARFPTTEMKAALFDE